MHHQFSELMLDETFYVPDHISFDFCISFLSCSMLVKSKVKKISNHLEITKPFIFSLSKVNTCLINLIYLIHQWEFQLWVVSKCWQQNRIIKVEEGIKLRLFKKWTNNKNSLENGINVIYLFINIYMDRKCFYSIYVPSRSIMISK